MECPDCDGNGFDVDSTTLIEIKCTTCDGMGDVPECDACGGDGTILTDSTLFTKTCPQCGGKGWRRR